MTARALPALLALVNEYVGRSIVVVSHKATIRLLLSALIGFDPRTYRDRLDQSPACLNVLDFKGPAQARLDALQRRVPLRARGHVDAEPAQGQPLEVVGRAGGLIRGARPDSPAVQPVPHAHWKLKPPIGPNASSTSPASQRPGTTLLFPLPGSTSSSATPPPVTSAVR